MSAQGKPQPSEGAAALAVGLDPSTVRRRIVDMEKDNLIRREERREAWNGSKTDV